MIVKLERLRVTSQPWVSKFAAELVLHQVLHVTVFHKLLDSMGESGVLVGAATTGIDGKYKANEIPAGIYLMHSFQMTDSYIIEWLVRIKVVGTQEAHMDLSNDNASIIIDTPKK